MYVREPAARSNLTFGLRCPVKLDPHLVPTRGQTEFSCLVLAQCCHLIAVNDGSIRAPEVSLSWLAMQDQSCGLLIGHGFPPQAIPDSQSGTRSGAPRGVNQCPRTPGRWHSPARLGQCDQAESMGIMQLPDPRPLNETERSLVEILLAPDFPGSKELRAQIPDAVVVGTCDCGCPTVDISVSSSAPRSGANGPLAPYEGRVTPLQDEPVGEILLFLDAGYISSLEYVFYADPPPKDWPTLDRVELVHVRS